jgi:hypothetical protein
MIEYSVGPDDLDFSDRLANADWVVYHYTDSGYDGRGTVVWKIGDKYDTESLGHCSCHGPMDDIGDGACMTLTQVLEEIRPISKTDYNYEAGEALYQKVMRLTREIRMGRE